MSITPGDVSIKAKATKGTQAKNAFGLQAAKNSLKRGQLGISTKP